MKFFRLDLLTLLISLFLLNSCKNEDTLGLAIDPTQQISGTLVDTATLVTTTALEDSVVTSSISNTPFAYFKDPVFGQSEANIATALNLPTTYTAPTGTVTIDSAVVVLRYANKFYGDSLTSKYKANIYQLTERPNAGLTYYNTKTWSHQSNLLGSATFNARSNTRFKITDIVSGKPDTLKSVPAQIRVKIDPSFIQANLFNASSTVTGNVNLFQEATKGLYITLDKNQTGNGGRMYLQLDSSSVDVYYRNTTTSAIDTTVISLPFGHHAAEIKHTFSTTVQTALNATTNQETVYLDGLAGTRTKISFPYLKNFLANAGSDIVLNRAELVITPLPGSGIPFNPLGQLTLYRFDIAHQRVLVPDAVGGSGSSVQDPRFIDLTSFGGYYSSTLKEYHFVITGYISDLMRGKLTDYGTYIAPIAYSPTATTATIAATPQAEGRTVAVGAVTNKASTNYPYRMKLNIIYTKSSK